MDFNWIDIEIETIFLMVATKRCDETFLERHSIFIRTYDSTSLFFYLKSVEKGIMNSKVNVYH